MPFREKLAKIVEASPGAIGAVLVDDEGETIDLYTTGDVFEMKLAGAHHGIVLGIIERALVRGGNGNTLEEVSIRSDRFTFTIAPLQDGIAVVLIQRNNGIPSMGVKALRDSIPGFYELI